MKLKRKAMEYTTRRQQMKSIDISINNAKIKSFYVSMGEEDVNVTATIGLYAGNKCVSEFSIRTEKWQDLDKRFDIPARMIPPILKIANQLEEIVTLHCSSAIGELTA